MDAINEYELVETFERYERLNECYRRNKDAEKQVDLIYHVINDEGDIPFNIKTDFKIRANRLFRNKKSIVTYDTDRSCPICGSAVKLTTLHKKNNISIFTCTKSGCYWYGGVYKGDLKEFSKINLNKSLNTSIDSSYLNMDVTNLSYDEKIKIKQRLVKQGNRYIYMEENGNAIEFYNKLLTHVLFENDYHPYRKLARVYHKDKQYEKETEIIISFFNSGIFCDETQMNWFLKRLKRLSKYDHIKTSKIRELESKFLNYGAKNGYLSDKPVPQAIKLKKSRKKF
ncbi:hypothetical protein [Methanobrevibacter sp.]|uniref:hypothetical protein n=1 Tax=Methanobrevibacter sp. TaxID=66852 RepID=UPI0025E5A0A1|nr:hypothetical protein [Methanobrevibacter sp.]